MMIDVTGLFWNLLSQQADYAEPANSRWEACLLVSSYIVNTLCPQIVHPARKLSTLGQGQPRADGSKITPLGYQWSWSTVEPHFEFLMGTEPWTSRNLRGGLLRS